MFAKLFDRITESSLMEEEIPTRYTFVMLLAIADRHGDVIGTDVAIARRLNMPLDDFKVSIEKLSSPDKNSNSREFEGRRLIPSEAERGYHIVNYIKYRNIKNEDERREYMRAYMAKKRGEKAGCKQSVNTCKQPLAMLAHTEAEAEAEADANVNNTAPQMQLEIISDNVQPARGELFEDQLAIVTHTVQNALDERTACPPPRPVLLPSDDKIQHDTAKSSSVRPKRKRAPTDKPKINAWGAWVDVNRERGLKDPVPVGPDTQAGKVLSAKIADIEELKRVYRNYLEDRDPWLLNQGHPLRCLPGRVNKYVNEAPGVGIPGAEFMEDEI